MNEQVKQWWLERLRDPKLKQGTKYLKVHQDDGIYYCCLGVLCEIAKEHGVVEEYDAGEVYESTDLTLLVFTKPVGVSTGYVGNKASNEDYEGFPENSETLLPVAVMEWAGLSSDDPRVVVSTPEGSEQVSLSMLNDSGATFHVIASYIEEQL